MKIIFHTGAHFTDDDRLIKCLLRNTSEFSSHGISVPGPGRYRQLLRSTLGAMRNAAPDPQARDVLLDAILDDETPDRVILSNAHFFGVANAAIRDGELYPAAAERMANLKRLFATDEVEMFMALRNPATFLPLVAEKSPERSMTEILGGFDPRSLRWSEMVEEVRMAAPDVPITLWCDEDSPLIWGQIIRDMAGLSDGTKITGSFDLLKTIMSQEGMTRFRAYLAQHPNIGEEQKRRVMIAFLGKYALEDALEEELDTPGWTGDLIDDMTAIYDEDLALIAQIPDVRIIAP